MTVAASADFRTRSRSNWISGIDGIVSLYRRGRVQADLERLPSYWRLIYYQWKGERFKLHFAFEDARLPEAAVRRIVEQEVERQC